MTRRSTQAPRQGYLEFSGALTAVSTGGSSVHLFAKAGSDAPAPLNIMGEKATLVVEEGLGHAVVYRKAQGYAPQPLTVRLPFQSELRPPAG